MDDLQFVCILVWHVINENETKKWSLAVAFKTNYAPYKFSK